MGDGQKKTQGRDVSVALFDRPTGARPCRQSGCARSDAVQCNYHDGTGNRCATTWCATHWTAIGGIAYCRRHANTILALGDSVRDPLALPDLDNRGPSLVNWVFRDLDRTVQRILEDACGDDERAVRDQSVTAIIDPARHRQWERSWHIRDADGNSRRRVTVAVEASDDGTILLLVDGILVASGIPPWIDRHRRGVEVTQGVDLTQRKIFYSFVIDHVHARIVSQRVVAASRAHA